MILEFEIQNQTLRLISRNRAVADSSGYLKAHFTFTSDWNNTVKLSQFKRTDSTLYNGTATKIFFNIAIDENGYAIIPWEVLVGDGKFNVNVYGQISGDTVTTITTNSVDVVISESGITDGELPTTPTDQAWEDCYAQIVEKYNQTAALAIQVTNDKTTTEGYKTAAETAKTAAETAKTNAETSATNSATSAGEAATSATNAANSATSASTSASTATTKASEASTSATAAKTSETNASTSETNAATSATNAETSATNAASSAATVQGYADLLGNFTIVNGEICQIVEE